MKLPQPITVVVVDPSEVTRMGSRAVLERDDRFCVVADASSIGELAGLDACPRLVVVDPALDGRDDTRKVALVQSQLPSAAVLLFTDYAEIGTLRRLLAGCVQGILIKSQTPTSVFADAASVVGSSTLSVIEGGFYSPQVFTENAASGLTELLTRRERVVLALLCQGCSDHEIGERLGVADTTVHSHVGNILRKASASNRVQLGSMAAMSGLGFGPELEARKGLRRLGIAERDGTVT